MSFILIPFLAIFCWLSLSSQAFSANNASTVMDDDWRQTFSLMKESKDPVAKKLLTWIYVNETNIPVDIATLLTFVGENDDWPRLYAFKNKIEKSLDESPKNPYETAEWFHNNPPKSDEGLRAAMKALLSISETAKARKILSTYWKEASLDKENTIMIAGTYRKFFSATDHAERLDNLIWQSRYAEAGYMLGLVDTETRALAQARIALARLQPKAQKIVAAVPHRLQNDQSLLYERIRWFRRTNQDDIPYNLLKALPKHMAEPELWWREQNIFARRAMEKHDFENAYKIVKAHQLTEGQEYAQAQWLLGWLDLRFLNKPRAAYEVFSDLYSHVATAVSKARAAYWAARSAESLKQGVVEDQWDKVSAQYLSTFYGQLSYRRVMGEPNVAYLKEPPITAELRNRFEGRELVRALRLLQKASLERYADPFLAKLIDLAKTKEDFQMIAEIAEDMGRLYYAVEANKQLQQKLGKYLFTRGYPLLPSVPIGKAEAALVHAIVHRESMFNPYALSTAGARGLMQLMPATAKMVSSANGRSFSVDKLTNDPQFNVFLGSSFLKKLVDNYDGFYPMAIAAYNAGPGNVSKWVDTFGDPRSRNIDLIDWIELIPIYETRNYVQRVMESWYIYRLRFNETPETAIDIKKG